MIILLDSSIVVASLLLSHNSELKILGVNIVAHDFIIRLSVRSRDKMYHVECKHGYTDSKPFCGLIVHSINETSIVQLSRNIEF